ncbi:MAG TPA: hypothetical protein DD738_04585, partial [Ruminiclostridium sp.]|nr:hypothetical protein [Ruminiclostridium sp.]
LEIGERFNDQLLAGIVSQEPPEAGIDIPVPGGSGITEQINQYLEGQGLTPTEKLVETVLTLVENQPDLPMDQASFLAGNKMEKTPEMAKILQKISANEFQLHHNLQGLKETLADSLLKADGEVKSDLLKPLILTEELDRFSRQLDPILPKTQLPLKEPILEYIKQVFAGNRPAQLESGEHEAAFATPFAAPSGTHLAGSNAVSQPVKELAESILSHAQNSSDDINIENIEGKPHAAESDMDAGNEKNPQSRVHEKIMDFPEKAASLPADKKALPQQTAKLLKEIVKTLENIHTKLSGKTWTEPENIKTALEKFFDRAAVIVENGEVQETILSEKTKALKEIMEFSQKVMRMSQQTRDTALPAYQEIDRAFEFFSRVTVYDSLLHIPIKMNGEDTSGELYVMKRKNRRKKLDSGNFTLFLSLQTSNLGLIESFLNAANNYVTISFRVEEEELAKLIKDRHRDLYDSLLKKGYKLAEMKCSLLEQDQTNVLDAAVKTPEFLGLKSKVDLKI